MKYGYECLCKENIEYLETLPIYKIVGVGNKKICISHSSPYSIRGDVKKDSFDMFDKLIEDYNCDMYLFGHEHVYYQTKYKGKQFVNVGSIGFPSDGLPFKYGIITIDNDNIEYEKIEIEYDYEKLEEYYKNSDYYKEVTIWCSLLLKMLKTGEEQIQHFLDFAALKATKEIIDITTGMPYDLFTRSYNEYIKKGD